jgi:polygalacturonase
LAGSFNHWNKGAMKKEGNKFTASVGVRPGNYDYKFVVDGHWCIDPSKPSKDDGHGNVVNHASIAPGGGVKGQPKQQQAKQQPAKQQPKQQPKKKDVDEDDEEEHEEKPVKKDESSSHKGLQLYPFKQNFANNAGKVDWLWKEDYSGW